MRERLSLDGSWQGIADWNDRGRYILYTQRIVGNLGKDPVAERLLGNLLR